MWIALSAVRPDFQMIREDMVRVANHLRTVDEAVADIVIPPND